MIKQIVIAIAIFAIISVLIFAMTKPVKEPVDKITESFGRVSGFFIDWLGHPDWIGIHTNSNNYRVSFLFKNAFMYVLFELRNEEWHWAGLWPYRKPVDLKARKKAIIEALEELERKRKFEELNKKLNIITS